MANEIQDDNKHTLQDLETLQSYDLNRKIQISLTRIMEWYTRNEGKCYVSFSGGMDSSVLAYLTAHICRLLNYKLILWFSNTGLEFPELLKNVKSFETYLKNQFEIEVETIIDYPKDKNGKRILFKDVVLQEGYPVISKKIAENVNYVQRLGDNCFAARCFDGRETGLYDMRDYKYLLEAPFKISNKCCDIMKKKPSYEFTKKTGLYPIIGTMADESINRKIDWLKNGCNAFDSKHPKSKPISFWTKQDILKIVYERNIPYPSIYGEIKQNDCGIYYTTGSDRTGCMFCAFGAHLDDEPNRFQRLKLTHPKIWKYCMKPISDGGLGMEQVLKYIGVKTE